MNGSIRVNIILVIIAVIAIIIAIFAVNRVGSSTCATYEKEYKENLKVLNDTIHELRSNIARYEQEIERIDLERENIKKELQQIIRNNEKVDSELANGDWDYNIKFLTDYLSKKDSVGE